MSLQSDSATPSSLPILSYTDRLAAMWGDFLLLVGRVLLGWIFMQSGWNKLFNIPNYATTFPRRGLEPWMAYISVPAEFICGVLLIAGLATRYAVLVLLIFTIVASFSSHAYWSVPAEQRGNQMSHFWKNASMFGGLVILFVTSAGRCSIDYLLARKDR